MKHIDAEDIAEAMLATSKQRREVFYLYYYYKIKKSISKS